jgi:hypothetical protein
MERDESTTESHHLDGGYQLHRHRRFLQVSGVNTLPLGEHQTAGSEQRKRAALRDHTGYRATVSYSDQDCKNFTEALVEPILCSNGQSVAVSFSFPANLPTQGIARYEDDDTTCADAPTR